MFAWLDLSFICKFPNKPLPTVNFSFLLNPSQVV